MGYTRGGVREIPTRAVSVIWRKRFRLYNTKVLFKDFQMPKPHGWKKSRDREVLMERAKAYPKPATAERNVNRKKS